MNDELLVRLVPFLAAAVAPVARFGDEEQYYAELERLSAAVDDVCGSAETRELISDLTDIIRDLAWAVDDLTGSDQDSRHLITYGNGRAWSIGDDGEGRRVIFR